MGQDTEIQMAGTTALNIGDTFGDLTVVELKKIPTVDSSGPRWRTYAICNCACGVTNHQVRPGSLMNGDTKSCGCGRLTIDGRTGDKEHILLKSAKQRARIKGLPFDITIDDITIPDFCPLLGIKLVHHTGRAGCRDNSPTLDRKVPKLGYVRGNVWVISGKANRIKTNATPDEIELVATKLKQLL